MPTTKLSTAVDRLARKCRIDAEQVEDAYPCTGLQAALIAASLNELGEYVSRFVFDLSITDRSPEAVRAGCEQLFERTAILRSRVIENNGQFLQVVVRSSLEWHRHDSLRQYLAQDRKTTIDLGKPLARFAWIQQPDGKAYMVWSLHHCQYDDWSFQLMLHDLNIASAQFERPDIFTPRTPYSKFIKALNHVDQAASDTFWTTKLRDIAQCRSISSTEIFGDTSRTSGRCEKSYTVQMQPNSQYQGSVLAVAAWSLLVAHFSRSLHVLFGHVLNGRTSDLQGIQEICGPTLATVPWYVDVEGEMTVKDYLETLQNLRLEVLPYEQTGLAVYRKLRGTAAFDTLLSVRVAQDEDGTTTGKNYLKPEKPDVTDLNHPCSIFLEVDMQGEDCMLKASFDDRSIVANILEHALDKFVVALETLSGSLETKLGDFTKSLQLPSSLGMANKQDPNSQPTPSQPDQVVRVNTEVMRKIEKLAISTAGVQDFATVNADTTLMQLGMDSLKTVVFSRNLSKAFGVEIPFKNMTGPGRTLSDIAVSIEKALGGNDSIVQHGKGSLQDLAEKYMESLRCIAPGSSPTKESRHQTRPAVLLTGATGYLGIEILRQCLAAGDDDVVVLVRCATPEEGLERITKTAKMALWNSSEFECLKRVHVWPSDISKDNLGLGQEHWQILDDPQSSSLHFRAFIHNGAKVDFLHTYADLEAANVQSTAILLAQHLKATHKPIFVFVTGGRPCPLKPDDPQATAIKLAAAPGYAQTKFVSELLVHNTKALYQSSNQTVQMSIVHPGSIIGGANTGVANTDDFVWRYVAASLSMGCYVPAVPTKREWINLTPVDTVAAKIVTLAFAGQSDSENYSKEVQRCLMRSGMPVRDFWDIVTTVLRTEGSTMQPVSEWEWLAELEGDLESKGQQQPLFSLSQLLLQGNLTGIGGQPPSIDPKSSKLPETAYCTAALRSNVQYLSGKGFLSRDGQQAGRDSSVFARSKA